MEENSPTGNSVETTGAQIESPTGQEQQQVTAEQSTQETISREQSQGAVSDDTANQNQQQQAEGKQTQTQQNGGDSQTDDGLAKFAKSQGVEDISQLDGNAQRFLKIAYDNQKAYRNSKNEDAQLSDASKNLQGKEQSLERRVAEMEYERQTDKFWSDTSRDRSLESKMVTILNEKVAQLTPTLGEEQARAYAYSLSRDLPTLYGLAQLQGNQQPVDAEAIRREERESIRQQSVASDTSAHASTGHVAPAQQVTDEWLENEYDSNDPKQRAMVDAYFAQQ